MELPEGAGVLEML